MTRSLRRRWIGLRRDSRRRRRAVSPGRSRRSTRAAAIRSRPSSTSSVITCASSAPPTTIAKASPRSWPSGRQNSGVVEGHLGMTGELPADATVAVIGAGAMGAGIAQVAAVAGHKVQLHDARFGAADAAKKGIADALGKLAAKGRITQGAADAAVERITSVVTL